MHFFCVDSNNSFMNRHHMYIQMEEHVQTKESKVYLKDIASIICTSEEAKNKLAGMRLYEFKAGANKKKVISVMWITDKILRFTEEPLEIHVIGANTCLVELYKEKNEKMIMRIIKTVSVALVTFLGAAFSIMTYDQDAGVKDVFDTLYQLFRVSENHRGILEITYAIGIGVGVFVFFHHFEKQEERTPTAMEIQMHQYEKDIVEAYVESAKRQGEILETKKR